MRESERDREIKRERGGEIERRKRKREIVRESERDREIKRERGER